MFRRTTLAAALVGASGIAIAADSDAPARRGVMAHAIDTPVLRIDTGPETATVRHTGEKIVAPTETVWRPMCGNTTAMTHADLAQVVQGHQQILDAEVHPIVVDANTRSAGIDVVFTIGGSVPADAPNAFAIAEAFIESQFSDPIQINVSVSFQNLGGGVLGATSSNYVAVSYPQYRDALIADMDADDTLHPFLPAGSTIPVRYNETNNNITNENGVFLTRGVYRAAVGSIGGQVASMTYNNAFNWDYNPNNGVPGSAQSLVDVVIHEVGHAMGFASGADFRSGDIEAIDLVRFQRTDGGNDYNPDTLAEFGTTPRTVDAINTDNQNSDLITVEHRMSDGNPWQASHFREQSSNIGIMDPALAGGQTFVGRGYYSTADTNLFDFIGYDFPACIEPGFLIQPTDQSDCAGGQVSLIAQALVVADYQWKKDGVPLVDGGNISGATTLQLTISNLSAADEGVYTCEITEQSTECVAESDPAMVMVDTGPDIVVNPPATATPDEGDNLNLNVVQLNATSFQWRRNGVDISDGGNVSGTDTATLTFTGITPANDGTYDVVLTSAGGCTATSTATLVTVNPAADPCFADCDGSGSLNVDDIDCFVAAFLGSDLEGADCDGNGSLNVDDIDCFVSGFLSGCP
ncbi:MAG: NF038122 family metalloprotease [Phycisphaerales bacterium]